MSDTFFAWNKRLLIISTLCAHGRPVDVDVEEALRNGAYSGALSAALVLLGLPEAADPAMPVNTLVEVVPLTPSIVDSPHVTDVIHLPDDFFVVGWARTTCSCGAECVIVASYIEGPRLSSQSGTYTKVPQSEDARSLDSCASPAQFDDFAVVLMIHPSDG